MYTLNATSDRLSRHTLHRLCLIASLDWKLGKAVWLRCQRYSNRAQNRAAMALFGLQQLWIVLGAISGFKLATFVAAHLAG
jgi:hypothetical protein